MTYDLDYGPICCKNECCGPGSYCCGHPDNDHQHNEESEPTMSERDDTVEQVFHEPVVVLESDPVQEILGVVGGGYVELGGQLFTKDEWDVVQTYARGHTLSAMQEAEQAVTPTMQDGVKAFHKAMGQPAPDRIIGPLPKERIGVRVELLREEFEDELIPALEAGDTVETIDACIDILYVTLGLLVEMGVPAKPFFDEVQRSNMSKLAADGTPIISRGMDLDGVYEGRVMKGPNYFKPNIGVLLDHLVANQEGWDSVNRGDYTPEEIWGVGGQNRIGFN